MKDKYYSSHHYIYVNNANQTVAVEEQEFGSSFFHKPHLFSVSAFTQNI